MPALTTFRMPAASFFAPAACASLMLFLAGCEPSRHSQFPNGSQLYDRTDHHRFGKVIGFEAQHDFRNGTAPEPAILIEQESDHTTVWGACTTCAATFDVKAQ